MPESHRRPRRLVALAESAEHVCYRTRVEAYRPQLEEEGWQLELLPATCRGVRLLRHRSVLAGADVVLLQRRLLPYRHGSKCCPPASIPARPRRASRGGGGLARLDSEQPVTVC